MLAKPWDHFLLTEEDFSIMTIQLIPDITLEEIRNCFNEAFADYFVPVLITASQMEDKMINDGIDLTISVGVFDQGKLVGFLLHGSGMMDGFKTAYNGGTGVVKTYRGNGLTRRMYEFVIPELKKEGYQLSVLETALVNVPAIKAYESVGFERMRVVHCFQGEVLLAEATASELSILPITLTDHPELQSWWEWQPTWQYSWEAACRATDQFQSLGAFFEGKLIGYVSFHPRKERIQQIVVRPDYRRRGIATALIQRVTQVCSRTLSVINVDEKDPVSISFFLSLGMEELLGQYEMKQFF